MDLRAARSSPFAVCWSTACRWYGSGHSGTGSRLRLRRGARRRGSSKPTSCGFKQVLLNLLSNAVKFTGAGGRVDVEREHEMASLIRGLGH